MTTTSEYDLSIIIPALNEAITLPALIAELAAQRDIRLEILVADGGSTDDTLACCDTTAAALQIPLQGIQTAPGRGRQMNAASRLARAEELLFLHADTTLDDPQLLARAWACMQQARTAADSGHIAGHFGLHFNRSRSDHDSGYYFYEAKSFLNRRDCINGDQGFWLARAYFQDLGGFDESLDYMEDARLANRIFDHGGWITLPGRLGTSARRFEAEGLGRRQTLNALLCNFERIGLHSFFSAARQAYRQQDQAAPLRLDPFLRIIHHLSLAEGPRRALRYWQDTGAYVAENAWQLAFQLDCRRNRRTGHPPGSGEYNCLRFYNHRLSPLVNSLPGRTAAALLTLLWFYSLLIKMWFRSCSSAR